MADTAILWLRRDLRLADHPALAAAATAARLLVVYIHAPDEEGAWAPGGASRWWLHHSLAALDADLRARGSRLHLARGPTLATLRALIAATGARAVHWSRRYEPAVIARDREVKAALRADGIACESHNAALWFEPWEVKNGAGDPYRVFTPFWRACLARLDALPAPLPAPDALPPPPDLRRDGAGVGLPLAALELLPRIRWDAGLAATWRPGAAGAQARLAAFLAGPVGDYAAARDRPADPATARLSPHLHFGEVGPREVLALALATGAARGQPREAVAPWGDADLSGIQPENQHGTRRCDRRVPSFSSAYALGNAGASCPARETLNSSALPWLRQLGWREFSYHLLYHHPHTPDAPLDERFAALPWRDDGRLLRAWQRGETGIPMVDAGMRELWHTGWMHNRVRMLVASLLAKHLLLDWRHGARWFWDTLVDADLANNTQGWQWTAGCGADAAPYFRIFNPVLQGQRFDPDGAYVRRWCPALARLPAGGIHAPWTLRPAELAAGGVELGRDYPAPIVDLQQGRDAALAAFEAIKRGG